MSRPHPSLRDAMTALARQELYGTEHPPAGRLVAYHRGGVPPAEAAAIADHLSLCRECAALVLDAAEFFAEDDEEEVAPAAPPPIPRRSLLRSPAFAYALAAAFAAVSVGLLILRPPAPSPRPQSNAGLYDLAPSGAVRGEEARATPIRFKTPRDSALLILNPGVVADSARYGVRIRRMDGSVEWQSEDLVLQPSGAFHLSLPAGALPPGRYEVELYGVTAGEEVALGKYPISIEK